MSKKYKVKSFTIKESDSLEVLEKKLEDWINKLKRPVSEIKIDSLDFQPTGQFHGVSILMLVVVVFKQEEKTLQAKTHPFFKEKKKK